jgi:hypothetical protein
MPKNFDIDIKGIPEVKKFLRTKDQNIKKDIQRGIVKSAVFLQGEVKDSIAGRKAEPISVDTGRFLNSVEFQIGNLEAKVFSQLPYARKLEFGTNFKNSPRKHFRNSSDRAKPKIRNIIANEVKKL